MLLYYCINFHISTNVKISERGRFLTNFEIHMSFC